MTPTLRPITEADDPAVAAVIRAVMTEYRCTGQGFAIHDPEVDHMSAAYPGEDGDPRLYYVVVEDGTVVGGAGFAPLVGSDHADRVCELQKMYFMPSARGRGIARKLLGELLRLMAAAGFRRCYLETTSWMDEAQRLYLAAGFHPIATPMGSTGHGACDRFYSRTLEPAAPS